MSRDSGAGNGVKLSDKATMENKRVGSDRAAKQSGLTRAHFDISSTGFDLPPVTTVLTAQQLADLRSTDLVVRGIAEKQAQELANQLSMRLPALVKASQVVHGQG